MQSIWASFVPHYLAKTLIEHPAAKSLGQEQRFEAAVLFSDIAGFTVISEALMATGRRGSEELTRILNSYFEPMIALIHAHGGIIGRFGGDSISVLFPLAAGGAVQAARQALACAQKMQSRMSNYAALATQAGQFSLAMKAGLAIGPLFCTTVGEPGTRLEYIIAGEALELAAEAEHRAERGQIVAHRSLCEKIEELAPCKGQDPFGVVDPREIPAQPVPLPRLGQPSSRAAQILAAFIHPSVAERIRDEQISFINEHRKVTVLFVGFGGFDYCGDSQVNPKLQRYFGRVVQVIQRYDGYLNKIDMGDKGSLYLVLFGAPIAHEDDAERALRCALDLRSLGDAPVHIGVNTGFVFSGQVGSVLRQEYTVMGDAVNLAARLMQAALPGQILVSEATYQEAGKDFDWRGQEDVQVKGKAREITIFSLRGLRARRSLHLQEIDYALPMVGRKAELDLIDGRIGRVLQGKGQIVGICAEAGMGKSRLAAEAIQHAYGRGLSGYGGECLSHGTTTSYLVWRNILRGLFGLTPGANHENQLAMLEAGLARIDQQFLARLPLLAAVVNLSIPENDVTRGMEARLRKESLEALLVACIAHKARQEPLLLVLEDCHWIDPLSNDLLETVGRALADLPVLLLVIYRPAEAHGEQPGVKRFGYFAEIQLTEFNSVEADELIRLKLRQLFGPAAQLPPAIGARITERAQGNPFFIDEMVNLIRDRQLTTDNGEALSSLELPSSLHGLIISRIDQLAEKTKTTLKVASVIGRTFRAAWIWGIYPEAGSPAQVKRQLTELSHLDITPLDKPEPELEYLFKHIITREVAYESLADATRAMLHLQTGRYIEQQYPAEIDRYLDLLAYHYGLSADQQKQRLYFRKAGDAARANYANEAALTYYQRLLPLCQEHEKSEIMLIMGEIWQLTGKWEEAESIFRQALAHCEQRGDAPALARCQLALGILLRHKGQFSDALRWLECARNGFESEPVGDQLVNCLREIGVVAWSQGDLDTALAHFQHCRQLAEASYDRRSTYRAIGNIGIVYQFQGDYDQALAYFKQGYQLAQEIDDRQGMATLIGNMGNIYLERGEYGNAFSCYSSNLNIAIELGDLLGINIAVGNMGIVYWQQGDYESALACQIYNLHIAMQMGDLPGISMALWYLTSIKMRQGDLLAADDLIQRAIRIAQDIDIPYELCDYLYSQAEVHALQGRYTSANQIITEALRLADEVEHLGIRFKGQVLAQKLAVLLGHLSVREAEQVLEKITEASKDNWQDESEQALVAYTLWKLEPGRDAHQSLAASLYRALYERIPNIDYKNRYEELTHARLPDPPGLPALPEIVTRNLVSLKALLERLELSDKPT